MDPFQIRQQEKTQSAAGTKSILRDTAMARLRKPRNPRVGRAIQLLDVLTSGDEALLAYLAENGDRALQAVEEAREDMALAESPQEAQELRADPMDELIARLTEMVRSGNAPTGGAEGDFAGPAEGDAEEIPSGDASAETPTVSMDLQSLKAALMEECKQAIRSAPLPSPKEPEPPPPPQMYLATCAITGCRIHSITPKTGDIIHHYESAEINTPALQQADRLLHQDTSLAYVEVHADRVCAVTGGGAVKEEIIL